uniref:Putative sulfotransferase n=1 Tax=Ixodes ricinus TaxID=34613 RepID=A0A090X8W5_IXORI
MAFSSLFCVSLVIAGAFAGSIQDANMYMDAVLRDHLPNNVRSLNLDPVGIPAFNVKVDSTGLTNRDLKAEFRSGTNVTTGCYVSLDGLRITFEGSAKGYDMSGSKKDFSMDLVVEKTNAFVEATSWSGRPAVLKTLTVTGVNFRINMNKSLHLNSKRQKKFEKAISQSVIETRCAMTLSEFLIHLLLNCPASTGMQRM